MSNLRKEIEAIIIDDVPLSKGHLVGFSDLEGLIAEKYGTLNFGITIGLRLDDSIIDNIVEGPTPEYAEHYDRVNVVLNGIASDVKEMLAGMGSQAEIIRATIERKEEKTIPNYYETLSADFPHKTAATRSGLGWVGKTALFVSEKFGPRVRLVTILTDMRLDTGQPVVESRCGDCDICVKECPAQAASGASWSAGMRREELYDAHKCRTTAKELAKERIGIDEVICGICVAVCPKGKQEILKAKSL